MKLNLISTLLAITSANASHPQSKLRKKCLVWTKAGLEKIPFDSWREFADDDSSSMYIKSFPWPGDHFTLQHYDSWKEYVDPNCKLNELEEMEYVLPCDQVERAKEVYDQYETVPTLFSDPIVMNETYIDYRLQFAADIGSSMIGESAAKGRLVNPAGRRLREHFYRYVPTAAMKQKTHLKYS